MFPSWCRKLVQSVLNGNSRRPTRRLTPLGSPGHFWRPRLEQLEDRIVPTTVSIPTNLTGVQGGIVTVPINVDTLSDPAKGNSGLSSGNFVVYYNPAIFSVSNADVNLGTIATPTTADPTGTGVGDGYSSSAPNGWGVVPQTYIPGYLDIGLGNSSAGIITNTGGGSLVTINFHIAANAPLGPTAIDLTANTAGLPPNTGLDDQNGAAYALGPNGLVPQDVTVVPAATQFVVTAAPTTITAGSVVSCTVTAEDQNGNTATAYAGTVHVTSTASAATVLFNGTLKNGVGTFSITLKTAGTQTLAATDTVTGSITGTSSAVSVSPAAATHLAVTSVPANITAGVPFNITVTAEDQFNNTATGYSGTVHIASSDSQAVLPAYAALTSGVGIFSVTLKTAGSQTLTAVGQPATPGGLGGSGFAQASGSPIAVAGAIGTDSDGVAAGDFNGDGKPDLAVVSYGGPSNNLSILLNNGLGTFSAGANYSVDDPQAVAVGDFNGDGKLDLAVGGGAGSSAPTVVSVLLGKGNGSFGAINNYVVSSAKAYIQSLVVRDFNGDGKLDLALSVAPVNGAGSSDVVILLGNGNGTFGSAANYPVGYGLSSQYAFRNSGLAVEDFRNDGRLDLVAPNEGSGTVSVLLGNGNGTFVPAKNYAVGNGPIGVAVADLNGDGNLDLAVTNYYSGTVSVLLGNGNGTFGSAANIRVGSFPTAIAAADLDGDGKPDLAVASDTVSVLLGNGDGTFGSAQNLPLGTKPYTYPGAVVVADFNGDGAPDLAVLSYNVLNNSVTILLHTPPLTASATVSVSRAAVSQFTVTAPLSGTAGSAVSVTVMATDHFGNIATSYSGTVHFSSGDGQAALPADQVLTSGVGKFTVTLKTAGNQTITATDTASSSFTGTSSAITVSAAAAARFIITGAPSTITAGTSFTITVTVQDAYGNAAAPYYGVVHFASNGRAALPLDQGFGGSAAHTFLLDLYTAGTQTVTITDKSTGSPTGSFTITMYPAAAAQLVIAAPNTITAGHPLVFVVKVEDRFGNGVTGYTGTVHFTSSDGLAILADDATLTGGTGFFAAALETAGSQTITATDTVTNTVTGFSNAVAVSAGPFNHFGVTAPATAITGIPFPITVTALDAFNNPAIGYSGTVHFTSSDSGATLPPDSTLAGGVGAFTAMLLAPGNQTITATDMTTSSIADTTAVAARGLVVSSFAPTSSGFVAAFDKPFDLTQLNLYNSASVNLGPADVTLVGPLGVVRGTLLLDPTDSTITFVKTSTFTNSNFDPSTGLLVPGTYTAAFRSASNGFKDLSGSLLDGNSSGVPGTNYVTTFVVNPAPVAVGVPSFARGPDGSQDIELPNTAASAGIPLALSNGAGVTSGQFTLQYNSALLNITGVTVNSALTGATLTLDAASTAGNVVIDFSTTGTLSSGAVRLGGLVATVPNSAASSYKDKALLHFASVSLNGGAIAALGDDAVQIVACLGNVSGSGTYSPLDAALISSMAINAATGFAAYALLDPVIVGDLIGNGTVNSADVTLMNAMLSGKSEPQVPQMPAGLTMVPTGPDPNLSVGRAELIPFHATPGSMVIVPVNIDTARPNGSTGMTEAILAVRFDPTVFTVSAAGVELGSLPLSGIGWKLVTAINSQTGEIGVDLYSTTPIQTTSTGSLVTIALQVRDTAPAGSTWLSLVNSVDPTGQRTFQTTVSDTQGAFVLHPAVTAQGLEPGMPSLVTVEQWPVNSGLLAVSHEQLAGGSEKSTVGGKESIGSLPEFGRDPSPTAWVTEQVFADLDPFTAPDAQWNSLIAADASPIAPGLAQANAVPPGLHDLALLMQPEMANPQDDGGLPVTDEPVLSPGRGGR